MILLSVTGQKAVKGKLTEEIYSGGVKNKKISFTFDSEWNGLHKVAQFKNSNVKNAETGVVEPHERILLSNEIDIPSEVMAKAGVLYVGLRGTILNETGDEVEIRQITNSEMFRVNDSGQIDLTEVQPVTPSMYEQLLDIATQARDDAAQAKADAALTAPLRDETLAYRNSAEGFKDQAEGAKDRAVLAEGNAEGFADDAEEQAIEALNNKLNGIEAHDTNIASHPSIIQDIRNVEAIARGRATAHVFDTQADMDAWLLVPENIATLVVGDNLYIRDIDVKDYWWDGESAQELEAEAPDLTDYYTKVQVDAMMPITITRTEYDALVASGTVEAGRVYDIYEG